MALGTITDKEKITAYLHTAFKHHMEVAGEDHDQHDFELVEMKPTPQGTPKGGFVMLVKLKDDVEGWDKTMDVVQMDKLQAFDDRLRTNFVTVGLSRQYEHPEDGAHTLRITVTSPMQAVRVAQMRDKKMFDYAVNALTV